MADMDKDLKIACRRRNWIFVMVALGFTGYTIYRVYHWPLVARKRAKISKFFAALSSAAEAFSDSAECIATISKDFKEFLHSDSDQIPHSLEQIAKLARSDGFFDSVTRLTQAIVLGVLRGYDQSWSQRGVGVKASDNSSTYTDRIMDKLFTASGSGFVSAVVGSFARNLVMAFFSIEPSKSTRFEDRVAKLVGVAARDEKCRELIGECIQLFVSSAVSVYLEKTVEINTFDQMFSGLTNPKHEREMRDLLISLSNGAVKTLIRTSHQVLTGHGNRAIEAASAGKKSEEFGDVELGLKPICQFGKKPIDGGWTSKATSTLAVSKNRKVIVGLTGRMTFEMVRSFLEVLLEKIYEGMKRCVDIVHEEVIERGMEVVRYATAKTSVIATLCLSLCLHVLDSSSWFLLAF